MTDLELARQAFQEALGAFEAAVRAETEAHLRLRAVPPIELRTQEDEERLRELVLESARLEVSTRNAERELHHRRWDIYRAVAAEVRAEWRERGDL